MHTILSEQDLYTPYLISIRGVIGTLFLQRMTDGYSVSGQHFAIPKLLPEMRYRKHHYNSGVPQKRDEVGAEWLVGGASSDHHDPSRSASISA